MRGEAAVRWLIRHSPVPSSRNDTANQTSIGFFWPMSNWTAPGEALIMSTRNESLSTPDFNRLRGLIYEESGINLNPDKKTMLEIRIKRRLQSLNVPSYSDYCAKYVFGPNRQEAELLLLIDAVTTNKTDFFREAGHFDFLVSKALPELAARNGANRRSLVWSAGCSTGEEPYTLAMVLTEYAQTRPGFRFNLLATDISTAVLAKARNGVFKADIAAPVPQLLRRKYFLRSRDPDSDLVRIVPELRAKVEFLRLNFMDADFGLEESRKSSFVET